MFIDKRNENGSETSLYTHIQTHTRKHILGWTRAHGKFLLDQTSEQTNLWMLFLFDLVLGLFHFLYNFACIPVFLVLFRFVSFSFNMFYQNGSLCWILFTFIMDLAFSLLSLLLSLCISSRCFSVIIMYIVCTKKHYFVKRIESIWAGTPYFLPLLSHTYKHTHIQTSSLNLNSKIPKNTLRDYYYYYYSYSYIISQSIRMHTNIIPTRVRIHVK